MEGYFTRLILQLLALVFACLLNASSVESRRRRSYRPSYQGSSGGVNTRGSDPLPWWVITLIFVGGVLGLFFCVLGIKKVYEKKRQQKIRSMMSRRSLNIRRRASLQQGNQGQALDQRGVDAPPSYDQSIAASDSLPPAYSKDVNTADELSPAEAPPPPTDQRLSVSMTTEQPIAPPSYDVAQNDGSEVVEIGGAVSMETSGTQGQDSNGGVSNVEV